MQKDRFPGLEKTEREKGKKALPSIPITHTRQSLRIDDLCRVSADQPLLGRLVPFNSGNFFLLSLLCNKKGSFSCRQGDTQNVAKAARVERDNLVDVFVPRWL